MDSAPEFYAKDRAAWRQWLAQNHQTEQAVWLVYDKGSERTMSWSDIVQESLCFGWIDSRPRKRDDGKSMIYISRRKPKSVWSKINKTHIQNLNELGLMAPAGLVAVEKAKANGSWDSLNLSDALVIPPELDAFFKAEPALKKHFESFTESNRRNLLARIYGIKQPATRANSINKLVVGLRAGKKASEL